MSATIENRAMNRVGALALGSALVSWFVLAIGGGPDWIIGASLEELPSSSRVLGLAAVSFLPLLLLDRAKFPRFPVASLSLGVIVSVVAATVSLTNVLAGGLATFEFRDVLPLLVCGVGCSGLALALRHIRRGRGIGAASAAVVALWLVPPALWWLALELSRNPIGGLANLSPPVALLNGESFSWLLVPGVVGWGMLSCQWLRVLRRWSRRSGRPILRTIRPRAVGAMMLITICAGLAFVHAGANTAAAQPDSSVVAPGSFEARFLSGDYRRADEHLPFQLEFSGALPTEVTLAASEPGSGLKVPVWSMRIVEPSARELLPVFLPARCTSVRVMATYGQGRGALTHERIVPAPAVTWNREGGRWLVGVFGELPTAWGLESRAASRADLALISLPALRSVSASEEATTPPLPSTQSRGPNPPPGAWTWQALACFDAVVVASESDREHIGAATLLRYMTTGGKVIDLGGSTAVWEDALAHFAGAAATPTDPPGRGWRATHPTDVSMALPSGLVFRDSHAAGTLWVVSDAVAVADELSSGRPDRAPLRTLLGLADGGGDTAIGPPIHLSAQSGLFHTHGDPQFAQRAAMRWHSQVSWWLAGLFGAMILVWLVIPVGWSKVRLTGMMVVCFAATWLGASVTTDSQPPVALATTLLTGAGGQGASSLTQWVATPGDPTRGAFASAITPHAWPTRLANSRGMLALLRESDGVWTVAVSGDTRFRIDTPAPSFAIRTVAATVRGTLRGNRVSVIQGTARDELPANLLQDRVRIAHGQSAADLAAAWVERWGWARHRLGFSLIPVGADEGGLWHTEPFGPPLASFDALGVFVRSSSEFAVEGPREWPGGWLGRHSMRQSVFGVNDEPLGVSRWAPGVALMWWPLR